LNRAISGSLKSKMAAGGHCDVIKGLKITCFIEMARQCQLELRSEIIILHSQIITKSQTQKKHISNSMMVNCFNI